VICERCSSAFSTTQKIKVTSVRKQTKTIKLSAFLFKTYVFNSSSIKEHYDFPYSIIFIDIYSAQTAFWILGAVGLYLRDIPVILKRWVCEMVHKK